ncbi:stage II sporulation protein M [Erythrobacter sp. WG]|uniref:stage II sporulation protein M n=1 Tax=Erythrobacter sp. WG TaxID=2985510 RepID=UPI002271AA9C|nr:stage II sporulation protein M [Erythrobacter sp. WG]MCX9146007.1 stage II sporulation protein M [Erythrobacter sp. WG]
MKAPILSAWFGRGTVEAPADIAGATLRSDRFRLEREGEWRRLEAIVARMEKGGLRRIDDADLIALPALYRTAASSLAVARETSLDAATLAYLEGLVQRAWFQVYGPRMGFTRWLRGFLLGGWSRAVRALWLDIAIALFVMVAGTIVGWLLVARDEAWYYRIYPAGSGDPRVPGASREQLLATLGHDEGAFGLAGFAAQLFSNNSAVCILAFALGFAFGIPSLLLLVHNLALLGALLWLFHGQGLTVELAAWLSVHGTTELTGIMLSGAAGLHIGRAMAFPGTLPVLDAAAAAGRRSAVVMVGVVIMMVVAAVLEAFPRQLVEDTAGRFMIGAAMLTFWLAYFILYRPAPATGEAAEAG